MVPRLFRWFDRHTWAGDAILATVLTVPITAGYLVAAGTGNTPWWAPAIAFLMLVPLYFRRQAPVAVTIATALVCLASLPFGDGNSGRAPLASVVVVPVVVYAAVKYGPRPLWWFCLGAGAVGSVLGPIMWDNSDPLNGVACFAIVLIAFLIGLHQRTRRESHAAEVSALAERNRLMDIEREQATTIAIARERAQLASETHDIIAHTLAVIVSQADGAVMAARKRPELAGTVLAQIADTGRDALDEIRASVAALRATAADPSTDLHPTRSLADLDAMIGNVRATGHRVDVRRTGSPQLAPLGVQLAAYRIVQESLTNVIKHAGPAASVTIDVEISAASLSVRVRDDGRGSAAWNDTASGRGRDDGHGNGIVGMRERAHQYGGTFRAGPQVGGGFAVSATFPLRDEARGEPRGRHGHAVEGTRR